MLLFSYLIPLSLVGTLTVEFSLISIYNLQRLCLLSSPPSGITMLTLTPAIIMELQSRHPGFPSIRGGIFVHRVIEGSPSEKAGLIPGDIVLGINGREIRSTEEVHDLVQKESKLNMTILRNQKVEYINVYPEEIQVH